MLAMSTLHNTTAGSVLINSGGALNASGPYTTIAGWLGVISPSSSGVLALVGADNETVNLSSSYSGLWLGAAPPGRPTADRSRPPTPPTNLAAGAAP